MKSQFKMVVLLLVAIAGLAGSLLIHQQAQIRLAKMDSELRAQEMELPRLIAEHERLSKLAAQADITQPVQSSGAGLPSNSGGATHLAKLQLEIETLRKQTNDLTKELIESRRDWALNAASNSKVHSREYHAQWAAAKIDDAKSLCSAFNKYAHAHDGASPLTVEQLQPFLPKGAPHRPVTGTNDFELVFQGSVNDLSNIASRAVAFVRERHPWLSPAGKWVRVYGFADGMAMVIESDDNFQSWEDAHVIPPD